MKRRIVLLGPPAAGKGSQAQMITRRHQIPAISTGQLLRRETQTGTALGRKADSLVTPGNLVPDDLIFAILEKWIEPRMDSFVLDGFPRTLAQAEKLESLLLKHAAPLDVALDLQCELPEIQERILHRVTCSDCETIFRDDLHFQAGQAQCPECGGKLERRSDDTLEILGRRMEQYEKLTKPLVEFYRQRNLLVSVCTERPFGEVSTDVETILLA